VVGSGRLRSLPGPPAGRVPRGLAPLTVVPEAPLERTEHGLLPAGEGWFVLNAKDARWHIEGTGGKLTFFEGDLAGFAQLGINVSVLGPGQPMAMYHWENEQEDFLVLSGEAVLVVEGQERRLRAWDLVHCPPKTKHVIVGAGGGPCVIVAVGTRSAGENWGAYTVDATAAKHNASVEEETTEPRVAYARFPPRQPSVFLEGWLP
jgi:uncharacterized cupin superfamily protein